MKVFSFDGPFARVMGRVFDLVLLHILWVVCSLPLITIGASTTALFTVTMKMVRNEESYILRSYVQAFKSNFKQATKLWLIMAAAVAWILWMLRICMKGNNPLLRPAGILNAAVLILLLLGLLYLFPVQAKFENSLGNTLKNAFICSLRFLPYSVGIAAIIVIPILLTGYVESIFPVMISLWLFGGSSLIAYGSSYLLNQVFDQVTEG